MTEFEPISKSKWLEKIQKDLKGASLRDFEWHLSDDLQFDPFIHASDLDPADTNLLTLDRLASKMPLAIISGEDVSDANATALSQLQQGAGAVIFQDMTAKPANLHEGIAVEMVSLFHKGEILSIQALVDDYELWRSEFLQSCYSIMNAKAFPRALVIKLGSNTFLNMSALRAARIVLGQMASDLDINIKPLKIIAVYKLDESIDLAENLQLSMPKVFAAYVAGVDHIGPLSIVNSEEQKWYHNLVHLLSYESDIPLNIDTLSGSFVIETLTNKIADNIWKHLLNFDNKK